jgi:hypothetical protein
MGGFSLLIGEECGKFVSVQNSITCQKASIKAEFVKTEIKISETTIKK